jgi:hypothetical protein
MSRDNLHSDRLNQVGIFLLLLISADTVFVIVHLIHISGFSGNDLYSLKKDLGYSEIFQYVKAYWVVLMLAALWWRTREYVYATWMLLFGYMLCDDAFQIHERGGGAIARYWGYGGALGLRPQEGALGLRAQDFGELAVIGVFGLFFLVLISLTYLRSGRDARNASKDLTLLFGVILFFGVIVDMLHNLAAEDGYVEAVLAVVEDGGEMFAMSVVCCYVFNLLERRGNVPKSLWQRIKTALAWPRISGQLKNEALRLKEEVEHEEKSI